MSDSPNLCRNCKHLLGNRQTLTTTTARCGAPQNLSGVDLVTGNPIYVDELCAAQRNDHLKDHCGIEGKWYELYIYPTEQYNKPPAEPKFPKLSKLPDLGME